MTTIHIEVTPDDIYNGVPQNALKCPIARAIKRDPWWRTKRDVRILGVTLHYLDGNLKRSRRLPGEAINFISNYDEGVPVAAFSFDLEVAR